MEFLVDDVRLYGFREGAGPPVLLLHGFGANLHTWSRVRKSLAEHNEVIAVDLKGFGDSDKPADGRYSLLDQAELIEGLIDHLRLTDVTLIGHSMGGGVALMTALRLASRQPNPLTRFVLIDSPAYRQAMPGFIAALRLPALGWLITRLLPAAFQTKRVIKTAYHPDTPVPDDLVEAYARSLRLPGAKSALIAAARHILPDNIDELTPQYANLDLPALLIHGRQDRVVPLWVSQRLVKQLPAASLRVIEHCGHCPQEEQSQHTARLISDFVCSL